MSMSRNVTFIQGSGSWTAPAGISRIFITPTTSGGVTIGASNVVSVTPNTTYTITINSATWSVNNANTFGSIFTWSGSNSVSIMWVE